MAIILLWLKGQHTPWQSHTCSEEEEGGRRRRRRCWLSECGYNIMVEGPAHSMTIAHMQ